MEIICKGRGIFSNGNMKPVNIIVGSSIPMSEISIAACWLSVKLEISKPKANAQSMSNELSKYNRGMLPLIGIPINVVLRMRITVRFINDRKK